MSQTDELVEVTQEDREAAEEWRDIECRHCSEYEGDFVADLAADFARHRQQAITAARAAVLEEAWQPIETAPKDGTPMLLFARCKTATAPVILVGWHLPDLGWVESSFTHPVGVVPTHWRPLPEPPRALRGE